MTVLAPEIVAADRGRVEVQVLGHYTDDVEWFGEEWTFEVQARDVPNRDNRDWVPIVPAVITWSGDSSPNNNDFHDLDDWELFSHTYLQELPDSIEVKQRGWENDRGPRRIYNCCSWWRNDDDDYGTGTETITIATLPNGQWQVFDWPNLKDKHGIRVQARVIRAPEISKTAPAAGCRGQTNLLLSLTGRNLLAGVNLSIVGPGVTVHDVSVSSDTTMTARVDIANFASLGPRDVLASNPDLPAALLAVLNGGFSVLPATNCPS